MLIKGLKPKFWKYFYMLLLGGSIFITSSKFVNSYITPKLYWFLILILITTLVSNVFHLFLKTRDEINIIKPAWLLAFFGIALLFATSSNSLYIILVVSICLLALMGLLNNNFHLQNSNLLWIISVLGALQAVYGISQYIFSTNQYNIGIKGSFDNPAGFAVTLSLIFPFALYLSIKNCNWLKRLGITCCFIIVISILLSKSRAGILAITLSSGVLIYFETRIFEFFKRWKIKQKVVTALIIFILFSSFLYFLKKDSANGRLLIWQISWQMIKEKPLTGNGLGSFKAEYMLHQANYFTNNENNKFELLADNVKHPLNEFILVLIEFGFIGLAILLVTFFFLGRLILKSRSTYKFLVLSAILALFIFMSFSYPNQYVPVWIITFFSFALIFQNNSTIGINSNSVVPIFRILTVIVFCVAFLFIIQNIGNELQWKKTATNSLKGFTEEMLPEYEELYSTPLNRNPFFLYNYGAELNYTKKYDKSIEILNECARKFNDYDLQLLLADNYTGIKNYQKAEETLKFASDMIPNRFYPLYQLVKLYQATGQNNKAIKLANELLEKPVKIPSTTIGTIKHEMKEFLEENKENEK